MHKESGFTIVELIVVILVIALLAAISIPIFLRQREKGYVAEVQSSLKQAATGIESYSTETGGDYSAIDGANSAADNAAYELLVDEGYRNPPHMEITVVTSGGGQKYCITAAHSALSAANPWETATYNSSEGFPSPDAC